MDNRPTAKYHRAVKVNSATKSISPELKAALVYLETLVQLEAQKRGQENVDRVTVTVKSDGRASVYLETARQGTVDYRNLYRDGDSTDPNDGVWVEEIPLYLQSPKHTNETPCK